MLLRSLVIATCLCLVAVPTAGQADRPAWSEMLVDPDFDPELDRWRSDAARHEPAAGPDGGPALVVEGGRGFFGTGRSRVSLPLVTALPGERLSFSVMARCPDGNKTIAVSIWSYDWSAEGADGGHWKSLGATEADVELAQGEWTRATVEGDVPQAADSVVVQVTHRGRQDVVLARASVTSLSLPPGAAGPDQSGTLTLGEVQALASRLRADVLELRGQPFEQTPGVLLVDRERYRRMGRRGVEAPQSDESEAVDAALRLLGLLEPGEGRMASRNTELADEASGHYDVHANVVVLCGDRPRLGLEPVLVHELGHASDEFAFRSWFRLLSLPVGDLDGLLVQNSLVEGSATVTMLAWIDREEAAGRGGADRLRVLEELEAQRAESVERLAPYQFESLASPYAMGVAYLRGVSAKTGQSWAEACDDALTSPPAGTAWLLRPAAIPPIGETLTLPDLSDDQRVRRAAGTLGEQLTAAWLGRPRPTIGRLQDVDLSLWTIPASEGWRADRWQLYGEGAGELLLLVSLWDDAEQAREFLEAVRGEERLLRRVGERTLVVLGGNDGSRRALADDLLVALAD